MSGTTVDGTLTGVLLMAYGEPRSLDEIAPYLAAHHGGNAPPSEEIAYLRDRYVALWGGVPWPDGPHQIRDALAEELSRQQQAHYQVYLGMRHWKPWIQDVLPQMTAAGIQRVIALPLAPHASFLGTGGYRKALDAACQQIATPPDIALVESWHMQPDFLAWYVAQTREMLEQFPSESRSRVLPVFVAHNMPAGTQKHQDVYQEQLLASSGAVAEQVGLSDWRFAYRNAETRGRWLEPDLVDYLTTLHDEGVRKVLVVPISSVYDEVEVIYELDVSAKQRADELGMTLRRTPLPNTAPACIKALAGVIMEQEGTEPGD